MSLYFALQTVENNKNKKFVKFQGDMLNFCDFIQVLYLPQITTLTDKWAQPFDKNGMVHFKVNCVRQLVIVVLYYEYPNPSSQCYLPLYRAFAYN